ncbi:hypothetical protein F2Q69_00001647 [Brassica cretica]|uniref:Syntaxin N-terminal domain-containing protein n=1 Tax=Brassica cretica TaxID=69181 RepID=A0A8S9PNW9_BRACR|nr:hypothetical protein F2Q69_00001647 [Brassica cretica]
MTESFLTQEASQKRQHVERRSPSRNPLWFRRRDRNHQNPNRRDHSSLTRLHNLNEETKSTNSAKILRGFRDMMEFNIVFISRKANAVQTLIDENRRTGSCVDMTRVSITNGVRVKLRETMSEFHRFRERIFAEYIEDGSTFLATGEDPSNEDMEKMISGNGLVMTFEVKPDMG